ncbi:MAG: heterocyst development glycosyltransferase HepC [Cyanobacteria bacterium P01_D01_bin.50]
MVQKQRSISVSLISYLYSKKAAKEKAFAERNYWNDRDMNYCHDSFGYKIKLNGARLLVKRTCKPSQMHLLSNRSEQFLAEWLQFSPATIVQIDSRIELDKLKMWANQCRGLGMIVFLRLSQKGKLYKNYHQLNKLNSLIKRWFDFLAALILLIILSPLLIALALSIRIYFKKPILQTQWCVGKQGKLFCIYNFDGNLTKIHLDSLIKLPQLFNVLKGDMSFIGRFPWSLAEVTKISPSEQHCLSFMPGITASMTDKR